MTSKHEEIHFHKSESFECDFNGKVFNTRKALLGHMRNHNPRVKCQICQVEIRSNYLNQHINDLHIKERKFQCKICDKFFSSAPALYLHNKRHEKKFECHVCSKMLPTKGHLVNHRNQI